jgi:uncharacterized protein with HEPN domain
VSSRSWRDCIQDILDAVAEIQAFTSGLNFEQFRSDLKTVRAVEMNFIVIGEAASAVPEEVQEQYPAVPWHLMRGMRNRLVHAYFAVDEQIMWDTVQTNLPQLVVALGSLMQSSDN